MKDKKTFTKALTRALSKNNKPNPLIELTKSQLPRIGGGLGYNASLSTSSKRILKQAE